VEKATPQKTLGPKDVVQGSAVDPDIGLELTLEFEDRLLRSIAYVSSGGQMLSFEELSYRVNRALADERKDLFEEILKEYCSQSADILTIEDVRNLLLIPSIEKVAWRSAATALITFILEYDTRRRELFLRSMHGGSNEAFFLAFPVIDKEH